MVPPREKPRIIDLRTEIEAEVGRIDADVLREHADELRELYFEIRDMLHAPLALRNTDGEKLSLHEIVWDTDDGAAVLNALRPLAGEAAYAEALDEGTRDGGGAIGQGRPRGG